MIEEMLTKNAKITARKQLYHALSLLFYQASSDMVNVSKAANAVTDGRIEEMVGVEVPAAVLQDLLVRQIEAIRPIYAISCALKSYKSAFGEYPEFTKFLAGTGPNGTEETLSRLVESGSKMLDEVEGKMRKAGLIKKDAPPLRSSVFGEEYIKKTERIKVKGE